MCIIIRIMIITILFSTIISIIINIILITISNIDIITVVIIIYLSITITILPLLILMMTMTMMMVMSFMIFIKGCSIGSRARQQQDALQHHLVCPPPFSNQAIDKYLPMASPSATSAGPSKELFSTTNK